MQRKVNHATETQRTGASKGVKKTDDQWQMFLDALVEEPNVSKACDVANITRFCAYDRKRDDPAFSAAWDEAFDRGYNKAEEEAWRRAVTGTPRQLFFKGLPVTVKDPKTKKRKEVTVLETSDMLLMFLMKGRKRNVFGDKTEVVMAGRKREKQQLTDEELDALIAERLGS
jgi:hypothetical protein